MRIFGLNISRVAKTVSSASARPGLARRLFLKAVGATVLAAAEPRGWFRIMEPSAGAWQRNVSVDAQLALSYHAVYACMTLIASDIAKLRVKLMQMQPSGVWTEATSAAFSPVLCKPNGYQTRNQFWESWVLSKLMRGNTYVLKERDARNVVVALHVLHPDRVTPLVAPDGSVYYQVQPDYLAGQAQSLTVPADEIIHDRMNCLFHPLVGVSPIFACGLAATQGLKIQNLSALFFENAARPGGILTGPNNIPAETAARLKEAWAQNYSGENAGRIAIAGDGLTYSPMMMTSVDAQLIEQLKWTAEVVCSTFHVPPYKIGVGVLPSYNNVQALNVEYYSQCLQRLIEDAEECLDDGLGIGWADSTAPNFGTEFDIDNLLRMDSVTQMEVLKNSAGILAPNEQRAKLDKPPKAGGDSPMLQQQNFSLAALAKRDAGDNPFALSPPADQGLPPSGPPAPGATAAEDDAPAPKKGAIVVRLDAVRKARDEHRRRAA